MSRGFTNETMMATTEEWYTPAWVFDALDCTFDLDPASPGVGLTHVPVSRVYTKADDGLKQPWDGFVWCNPPYGRGIEAWLNRCARHANAGRAALALVPNQTESTWFYHAAQRADAMLLIGGRIKFHRGSKSAALTGSSGTGLVIFAYGNKAVRILKQSRIPGVFIEDYALKGCFRPIQA